MTSAIDKLFPFSIPSKQTSKALKERKGREKEKRHTIENSNLALTLTRTSS